MKVFEWLAALILMVIGLIGGIWLSGFLVGVLFPLFMIGFETGKGLVT